ncbi:MAG: gamma-glutamylcyclotransferase family protein [Gammaproteobacteria bacterium]|nr:gamma-glutamylcyclotransferase family protein [Gammaproteobacteria bacterium]
MQDTWCQVANRVFEEGCDGMLYFAYGSNMTLKRMRARTPSARHMGVYSLYGHVLKFHKIGRDGSAKCNAHFTGDAADVVEGVVYVIHPSEVAELDTVEDLGIGYEQQHVTVKNADGQGVKVFLYSAILIDDSRLPFLWYKQHVLEGAKAAGLSQEYVNKIKNVQAVADPDTVRERREMAIHY